MKKSFFGSILAILIFSIVIFLFPIMGIIAGLLTTEKQEFLSEEEYIINQFQEDEYIKNNTYTQLAPYTCGIDYICEVHEYLAPPYTEDSQGYILYIDTDEEFIIRSYGALGGFLNYIIYKEIQIASSSTTTIPKL